MKRLVIVGTGLFAEVAYYKFSSYEVDYFTVEDGFTSDSVFCGLPVIELSR